MTPQRPCHSKGDRNAELAVENQCDDLAWDWETVDRSVTEFVSPFLPSCFTGTNLFQKDHRASGATSHQ